MIRAAMQMTAAASIAGFGDAGMQLAEGRKLQSLDVNRAARLCAFRMAHAPVVDFIWKCFDRKIVVGALGTSVAVRKALTHQALIMPPSVGLFFISQALLEGLSWQESLERVRESILPLMQVSLPYGFSVHCITFSLIPEHLRIVWASTCAVAWTAYMSHANEEAKKREGRRLLGEVEVE